MYKWLALRQLWCNVCLENKPSLGLETNYKYFNPKNLISHFLRNYAPVLFLTILLQAKYELSDKLMIQNFINSHEKTLLNFRKDNFQKNVKHKKQIKNNVVGLMQKLGFNKVDIQRFIEEIENTTY